ncbi:methylated-DNA--[protein]-cysteine S-methyltransferase [Rhodopila sp.]|uniref:methylated-DNA--[protein]-cysteine S-methyltransferase n=1 Tax=Rhodopila sp. TaxID=2480087 RepID=UPI003D0CDF84
MSGAPFHIEQVATPTGPMLLLTDDDDQVRSLEWQDHTARMHQLLRLHCGEVELRPRPGASPARRAVEAYFGGDLAAIERLPVKTAGTAFQRAVWAALRAIPVGETTTYGRLAARLGRAGAMRAVGMANGANPIGIIVPCHRVIGANAALTGYGGGVERKRWLLRHEGAMAELAL